VLAVITDPQVTDTTLATVTQVATHAVSQSRSCTELQRVLLSHVYRISPLARTALVPSVDAFEFGRRAVRTLPETLSASNLAFAVAPVTDSK
jgi:hypothetical protein